jgi:hypothetical protein
MKLLTAGVFLAAMLTACDGSSSSAVPGGLALTAEQLMRWLT